LHKAEALATQVGSQRKAVNALKQVIKRHPKSEFATRAEQKLRELGEL